MSLAVDILIEARRLRDAGRPALGRKLLRAAEVLDRAEPILAVLDEAMGRGGIRIEPLSGCRLTLWPSVFDDDHWHVTGDSIEAACRKALAERAAE